MVAGVAAYVAVVRRDQTRRFAELKQHLEEPGVVRVIWDRRVGERRSAPQGMSQDRRRNDRRSAPAATWDVLDFVLARTDEPEPAH